MIRVEQIRREIERIELKLELWRNLERLESGEEIVPARPQLLGPSKLGEAWPGREETPVFEVGPRTLGEDSHGTGKQVCERCGKAKGPSAYKRGSKICRVCHKVAGTAREKIETTAKTVGRGPRGERVCQRCARTLGVTGFAKGRDVCRKCEKTRGDDDGRSSATGSQTTQTTSKSRVSKHGARQAGLTLHPAAAPEMAPNAYRMTVPEYKRFKRAEGTDLLYKKLRKQFPKLTQEESVALYAPKGDVPEERVPGWEILA